MSNRIIHIKLVLINNLFLKHVNLILFRIVNKKNLLICLENVR